MSLERALALVEAAPRRGYPNPTVGAVVVDTGGAIVGEGVSEPAGGRHAEIVALDEAGEAARGRDALRDDGAVRAPRPHAAVRRRDRRRRDRPRRRRMPRPEPEGGGWRCAVASARGSRRSVLDLAEARRQNEAWRTWVVSGRPYVILKLAVSLDGRAIVPGRRWVTGEDARRRVHELRATVDAVAVGMGTVRADAPRLDARDVRSTGSRRRLAFGRGPLPDESTLELRSGSLDDELGALGREGVQSLLLEGGPTIATAFLTRGLVDRLLLFVAPVLAGDGPPMLGALPEPIDLPAPDARADRRRRAPRRAVARDLRTLW